MAESEKVVLKYVDLNTGQVFDDAATGLKFSNWKKEDEESKKADEIANKNPPFIQLTKGISPAIISKIADESAVAVQVLMFFLENMDSGNVIMVAQKEIATQIKKTRQAVSSGIKILEKNGAIALGKIGNAHVYLVNPHLAWQKAFKLRNTAILNGTFILGRDENKELFKEFANVFEVSAKSNLTVKSASVRVIKDRPDRYSESLPNVLHRVKNEKPDAEDEFENVPPWEQEQE